MWWTVLFFFGCCCHGKIPHTFFQSFAHAILRCKRRYLWKHTQQLSARISENSCLTAEECALQILRLYPAVRTPKWSLFKGEIHIHPGVYSHTFVSQLRQYERIKGSITSVSTYQSNKSTFQSNISTQANQHTAQQRHEKGRITTFIATATAPPQRRNFTSQP